jgi:hypothetical protein
MNGKLPMDVIAEYEALRASSSRLRDIDAGIAAKVRSALGAQCQVVTDEQRHEVLTQRQRDWRSLRDFYNWMNSSDLFGYLGMIYRNPEAFRAIGATKTLTAAEALRDLYDQHQALETEEEKNSLLLQTLEQRQPIEQSADGLQELANLLIAFAEAHPDEFPSVPAGDAFDNLFSYLDALSEQISLTKQ